MEKTNKYNIRYLVMEKTGGKRTVERAVEFTKPQEQWNRKSWEILTDYLRKLHGSFCDVVIISIKEIS